MMGFNETKVRMPGCLVTSEVTFIMMAGPMIQAASSCSLAMTSREEVGGEEDLLVLNEAPACPGKREDPERQGADHG
jgi:hypothetical protein